ncbi:MAG: DUF192 domain-containing protein [Steroidobacteraceae bacterium]
MNPRLRDSRRALALVSLLAAGLLLAAGPRTRAQDAPALEDLAAFPRASLEISARGGTQRFAVWVADTRARQAQGLMFVRDLAPDAGMLFVAQAPREMSMWMKNTYIPLDMLFIAADGRIVRIAARTKPHSLDSISSYEPVTMVLELRGGEADRRGIQVGDHVRVSPDSA